MTDLPPSLAEVIHDEDREYAKKELTQLIHQLETDGKKTRSILRALVDVMMQHAVELPTGDRHYDFLRYVRDAAEDGLQIFEAYLDKDKNTNH